MSTPARPPPARPPVPTAAATVPSAGAGLPRPPPPLGSQQQQQQQPRPPLPQQRPPGQQQQRPPMPQQGIRPNMPSAGVQQSAVRPGLPQAPGEPSATRPSLPMPRPPQPVGQPGQASAVQQQQQQPVKPPPKTKKERDRERDREKERERARERERERALEKEVAPGPFAASLGRMMYGFGDEETPANDTVHVMEDLLGHFITDLCTLPPLPGTHATTKARQVTFSHLHHQLSSHPASRPLLHRLEELAILQKDIKEARKTMDPTFSTGMGVGGPGEDDGAGGLLGNLGPPAAGSKKRGAAPAPSKKKKRPNDAD